MLPLGKCRCVVDNVSFKICVCFVACNQLPCIKDFTPVKRCDEFKTSSFYFLDSDSTIMAESLSGKLPLNV